MNGTRSWNSGDVLSSAGLKVTPQISVAYQEHMLISLSSDISEGPGSTPPFSIALVSNTDGDHCRVKDSFGEAQEPKA